MWQCLAMALDIFACIGLGHLLQGVGGWELQHLLGLDALLHLPHQANIHTIAILGMCPDLHHHRGETHQLQLSDTLRACLNS